MEKLKISDLLNFSGAFVFTYSQGGLYDKEGNLVADKDKQTQFSALLDAFPRKKEMFEYLSNAREYLNSPKPSVGFFVVGTDDKTIQITRLYFLIGISTTMVAMGPIAYQKFFDEFIDLEGRTIVVKDPVEERKEAQA